MADVSISDLDNLTPVGTSVLPISDGTTTGKASIASLPVNYNNLTNKPTIPAAQVNSDWNATSGVAQILNKPTSLGGGINGLQSFTSGSGTWTVPANITKVKVTVIGGGGGGNGGAGTSSTATYSGTTITGGGGGTGTASGVGAGGTATGGDLNIPGSSGYQAATNGTLRGAGGLAYFGSRVYGGGANGWNNSSGGGGAGGTAIKIFTVTPSTTISYTVGTGGLGGGSGGIVIIEW